MTRAEKAIIGVSALLCFVVVCMWASLLWASPYLVCDPTSENVGQYEIEVNGVIEPGDLQQVNGMVRIRHSIAVWPDGAYIVRARAGNFYGWSDWSDPLEFAKAIPNRVGGLGIER